MASRRRRFRRRPKIEAKRPTANEEITTKEVRLIGSEGEQLGVISTQKALALAEENNVDLVLVAEKADPPVARIMDIGKHMYEQRKKKAKQKALSKSGGIKGIRISYKIGEHDQEIRLRQTEEFLSDGHKVKVEMRLRGREKYKIDTAKGKIIEFVKMIPGGAEIEGSVSRAGGNLSAMLTRPRK